jgi:hypothetical protein
MRKRLILAAACTLVAQGAWASDAFLNPAKDNTIWNDTFTELSSGQGPYLFVGANAQLSVRRALVTFDLPSAVPTNAIVTSASLTVNVSKARGTANIDLHKLTKNWGEGASDAGDPGGGGVPAAPGDATWIHNFFNTSSWTTPGGDFSNTVSGTAALGNGLAEFADPQMAADIQAWMSNPATNFGWILKAQIEDSPFTVQRIDSLQNTTPENRPTLKVTYNASTWNTGTGIWSGAGNWNFGIPNGVGAEANFSFQSGPTFNPITVTVDSSKTLGTINFNSQNAYNLTGSAITLNRTGGITNINVLQGSHQISSALTLSRPTNITVASGSTLAITGAMTASGIAITKLGEGSVRVNNVRADSLNVNAGRVIIAPNGTDSGVSRLSTLAIDGAAALDLNDNDLVVNTGDFATLQSLVFTGYRGGPDTTATGITSTTSQTTHAGTTILALFDNALAGFSDYPFGSGNSIATGAIVGKYTYIGDTNFDGQVTPQDYTATDSNLGTSVDPAISWFYGDTNFDGNIDPTDYAGIDGALGLGQGNPLAASGLAPVPEPTTLTILLGSGLLLSRFRRR